MTGHGHFATTLEVRWLADEGQWQLLAPLVYVDPTGHEHEVPEGARTDLASIPRLLRSAAFSEPKTREAAVLHDWLYRESTVNRRWADALFYHGMCCRGVGALNAWLYWLAVRLFGGMYRGDGA